MIWWQYWPYWIWVSKWPGNNIDPTGSVVLWKIPFFRWVWSPFPSWWTISPRYRWRRRTLSHNRLSFLSWAWRSVSALRWHGLPNSFVCLFSWKDKSYVTNYGATIRLTLSLYAVTKAFQSFQILAGLFFDHFPKPLALLCFGLSSFGFAMTCGLFISISVTRIFIIVKVKHSWIFWMRIFGFKYIRIQQWGRGNKSEWPTLLFTARSLPQLEPHEGLLFWILWSGTPFSCLHLCSSCPLPRQGYGWAGNKNEMLIP